MPGMTEIQITQHGAFQIATSPSKGGGFTAWGKKGKITGADPIREPGDPVWFGHGRTREQAQAAVMRDIEQQQQRERVSSAQRLSRQLFWLGPALVLGIIFAVLLLAA